jgi:hypothetical protein
MVACLEVVEGAGLGGLIALVDQFAEFSDDSDLQRNDGRIGGATTGRRRGGGDERGDDGQFRLAPCDRESADRFAPPPPRSSESRDQPWHFPFPPTAIPGLAPIAASC